MDGRKVDPVRLQELHADANAVTEVKINRANNFKTLFKILVKKQPKVIQSAKRMLEATGK